MGVFSSSTLVDGDVVPQGTTVVVATLVSAVPRSRARGGNHLAEMLSGSEEGSYLRLIDFCITRL